jgi:hypothetical protein
MRGAHSRFERYYVHHRAGIPPRLLFSGDDDGMRSGHIEVSLSHNGSSDVQRSNALASRTNPKLPDKLRALRSFCQCETKTMSAMAAYINHR